MNRYSYLVFIFCTLLLTSCGTTKKTVKRSSSYSRSSKPTANPSSKAAISITAEARRLMKKPYRYGGESPSGFDCSGLVKYVYAKQGVQLPRRSADQARYGKSVAIRDARLGDLIFFKSGGKVTHVGIVSNTQGKLPSMIHSSSSAGVSEVDLDTSDYWRKRFAYIRRP